jgi:hypothetical protein
MNHARLALFALPVALATFSIACGSSSSSSSTGAGSTATAANGSSAVTHALHGTYVPVGDSAKAEFARLTFSSATDYSYVRANCVGATCSASGTYVFDGSKDLALRDGVSGSVEHVAFSAVKTGISNSVTQLRVNPGRTPSIVSTDTGDDDDDDSSGSMPSMGSSTGGGLVTSGGSLLDDGGGALIADIVQAIMNGILMALENQGDAGASGDDDGSGSGDGSACGSPDVLIACFAAGGVFTASASGSCSCQLPDGGTPDAMP